MSSFQENRKERHPKFIRTWTGAFLLVAIGIVMAIRIGSCSRTQTPVQPSYFKFLEDFRATARSSISPYELRDWAVGQLKGHQAKDGEPYERLQSDKLPGFAERIWPGHRPSVVVQHYGANESYVRFEFRGVDSVFGIAAGGTNLLLRGNGVLEFQPWISGVYFYNNWH
jgi:hypothetical protein